MSGLNDLIIEWTATGNSLVADILVVWVDLLTASVEPIYVMPGETVEGKTNNLENHQIIIQTINL